MTHKLVENDLLSALVSAATAVINNTYSVNCPSDGDYCYCLKHDQAVESDYIDALEYSINQLKKQLGW